MVWGSDSVKFMLYYKEQRNGWKNTWLWTFYQIFSLFIRSHDLTSQGLCFLCTGKILLCPSYIVRFYENQERKNHGISLCGQIIHLYWNNMGKQGIVPVPPQLWILQLRSVKIKELLLSPSSSSSSSPSI